MCYWTWLVIFFWGFCGTQEWYLLIAFLSYNVFVWLWCQFNISFLGLVGRCFFSVFCKRLWGIMLFMVLNVWQKLLLMFFLWEDFIITNSVSFSYIICYIFFFILCSIIFVFLIIIVFYLSCEYKVVHSILQSYKFLLSQ